MIQKKMHTAKVFLLLALMPLMPVFSVSQVSIISSHHIVQPNEVFSVSVKAVDFNDILTCQFSMSWDSTAFDFLGTEGLASIFLPYPFPHFGFSEMDSSKMGFSWADLSLAGVSLSDSTQLFAVKFRVIAEESGDYAFHFGATPTAIEIADVGENVLEVSLHQGNIRIEGTSSQRALAASEAVRISCAPNPFRGQPQLRAEFSQAAAGQVRLHSADGRLLYESSRFFPEGSHELSLPADVFALPGAYWLTIQGKDFSVVQKLIAL